MSANFSDTEEKQLSVKQEKLIAALIAGNSIVASAKTAEVSERTAHTWLKQPVFKKAYEEAKQAVFEEALEKLRSGTDVAIDALKRNMTEAAPYVQVAAASKWLDLAVEVHRLSEIVAQIAELEELIKAGTR